MKRVFTKQEAIDALRKQHSIPQEETIEIEGTLWGTYTPNDYRFDFPQVIYSYASGTSPTKKYSHNTHLVDFSS